MRCVLHRQLQRTTAGLGSDFGSVRVNIVNETPEAAYVSLITEVERCIVLEAFPKEVVIMCAQIS